MKNVNVIVILASLASQISLATSPKVVNSLLGEYEGNTNSIPLLGRHCDVIIQRLADVYSDLDSTVPSHLNPNEIDFTMITRDGHGNGTILGTTDVASQLQKGLNQGAKILNASEDINGWTWNSIILSIDSDGSLIAAKQIMASGTKSSYVCRNLRKK